MGGGGVCGGGLTSLPTTLGTFYICRASSNRNGQKIGKQEFVMPKKQEKYRNFAQKKGK